MRLSSSPSARFLLEDARGIVAPQARQHRSADALFSLVRTGFSDVSDFRLSDTDISLTDTLMSAFAMFSLKSPSLLAFDKAQNERACYERHTGFFDV